MNNKPIGIFDSGIGGLTVVKSITDILPKENIIYFGDTANVPYGVRKKEEIIALARKDAAFLNTFDLKAILIACNTVDAVSRKNLEREYSIPILGAIEPASRKALAQTENNRIGIIATPATVASNSYVQTIHSINPDTAVFQQPCEKLVPLIEEGKFKETDDETFEVLKEYLFPLVENNIDTLILGCTHYPLIQGLIEKIIPGITVISSSLAAAENLKDVLSDKDLLADTDNPTRKYYVSKDPVGIKEKARYFMPLDHVELKV